MVAIGNVNCWMQVNDWDKHVVGHLRMLAHYHPFFLGECSEFAQDIIWDANLTNIMQQGTSPDVGLFLGLKPMLAASRRVSSVTRCV